MSYDEKLSLGQLKICVEKMLKKHDENINKLKQNSINTSHFNKLRAAFLTQFMWNKNDTITIGFMGDGKNIERKTYDELSNTKDIYGNYLKVDPLQKVVDNMPIVDGIKLIIQERIQPLVSLKLQFIENYKDANVRIDFNPAEGAWSVVGKQCLDEDIKNEKTMNLGWFDVATTIHEFGHVLGLVHEHQNIKDNPIQWDKDAVYKWALSTQGWDKETTDINILQKYDENQINGSVFDPLSIMLYFFPPELTLNNRGTNQNLRLSGYDVKYINKNYPETSITPEEFYVKTYNETLESNLELSKKLLESQPIPVSQQQNNYLVYIIIGLSIIILILLFSKIF